MIHNKEQIIKTVPYLVQTRRNTVLKLYKYNKISQTFKETRIDSRSGRYMFWACRDNMNNLVLIDSIELYFIHSGTSKDMKLDNFFEVCREANKDEIQEIENWHESIKI